MKKEKVREPQPIIRNGADEFMSIRDAMILLGVSEPTIQRRFRDGTLKRIKFGSRTLIRRADLYAALEA